jgi:hypothetical protein
MSEKRPMISAENQQTVLAVCFVLALLSVVFNFYNYTRINRVISATARMNNINVEQIEENLRAQQRAIGALEKKQAEMDGKMSTMSAPAPAPATAADVAAPN